MKAPAKKKKSAKAKSSASNKSAAKKKKVPAAAGKKTAAKRPPAKKAAKKKKAVAKKAGAPSGRVLGCCTLVGNGPAMQIEHITREQCRLEGIARGKNDRWVAGECAESI